MSLKRSITDVSFLSSSTGNTEITVARMPESYTDGPPSPTYQNGNSREKIVYGAYRDGYIDHHKLPLADVTQCFVCDQIDALSGSIEKTSYKCDPNNGLMPVYRKVLLCSNCLLRVKEAKKRSAEFCLTLTSKALSYF